MPEENKNFNPEDEFDDFQEPLEEGSDKFREIGKEASERAKEAAKQKAKDKVKDKTKDKLEDEAAENLAGALTAEAGGAGKAAVKALEKVPFLRKLFKAAGGCCVSLVVGIFILAAAFTLMGAMPLPDTKTPEKTPSDPGPGGGGIAKIVEIAQKEVGTCSQGGNNCGPPKKYHCLPGCPAWCAAFVSWVYKEAGYPLKGVHCEGKWSITYGASMQNYFKNEVYFRPGELMPAGRSPQPGDVIGYFPTATSSGHVGIVKSYNPGTGELITIEGNGPKDCVEEERHNLNNSAFRNTIQMFGRLSQFD